MSSYVPAKAGYGVVGLLAMGVVACGQPKTVDIVREDMVKGFDVYLQVASSRPGRMDVDLRIGHFLGDDCPDRVCNKRPYLKVDALKVDAAEYDGTGLESGLVPNTFTKLTEAVMKEAGLTRAEIMTLKTFQVDGTIDRILEELLPEAKRRVAELWWIAER